MHPWAWLLGILRAVIDFCYLLVKNHGWSIVLFTVLIKAVLMPFDLKSRKSMQRMQEINPKIQALQKKYANDKEKLQQKQSELYKKEKINPMASCLPMLLTMPVLFAMFAVMRTVANEQLAAMLVTLHDTLGGYTIEQAPEAQTALQGLLDSGALRFERWLWIKNIWMADSPFGTVLPLNERSLATLSVITDVLSQEKLDAVKAWVTSDIYQQVVLPAFNAVKVPGASINLLVTQLDIYKNPNGFLILPILAALTQYLSTLLTPQQQQDPAAQGGQAASTGQMMKYAMPLFSLFICVSYTAAFALYWVAANIIQIVEQLAFTQYFKWQDKRKAAQPAEAQP